MILVTGGAGFIGSAMVWKLNQVGYTDIIIADSLGTSEKWKNLVGLRFADYLDKDDCLHKLLAEKFPRLDAIIHMGAISTTTEKNLDVLLRSNYEYTKELAAFAVQRSIRFIYASSAATYGDGSQGYDDDESKLHTLRPQIWNTFFKMLFYIIANAFLKRLEAHWTTCRIEFSHLCLRKILILVSQDFWHRNVLNLYRFAHCVECSGY